MNNSSTAPRPVPSAAPRFSDAERPDASEPRTRPWAVVLVASLCAAALMPQLAAGRRPAFVVAGLISLVLWVHWMWRRERGGFVVAMATMVLSSVSAVGTGVVGGLAVIAVTADLTRNPRCPWSRTIAGLVVSALGLAAGSLAASPDPAEVIGAVGGIGLAGLLGLLRRQTQARDEAERRSLRRELDAARERALHAAAQERAGIARDLHDVLAHSLGGLAIQLAALDAELESGQVDAARRRTRQAQELARSGLADARRAVAVLREDAEEVDFVRDVEILTGQHRRLGGDVELRITGRSPTGPAASALSAAVRECLTNARRHSPGARSRLVVEGTERTMRLRLATPRTGSEPTSRGGGHGLRGVRERVEAVGGKMDVTDGNDEEFVVTVEVPA